MTEAEQHWVWSVLGLVAVYVLARYEQMHSDLDDHLNGGPVTM